MVHRLRLPRRHLPKVMTEADGSRTLVLIASSDLVAAALVGGLVETLGYRVEFSAIEELPSEALRRTRPAVYLIDCATTRDCTDEIVGRAMMRGVSVVLFGPGELLETM